MDILPDNLQFVNRYPVNSTQNGDDSTHSPTIKLTPWEQARLDQMMADARAILRSASQRVEVAPDSSEVQR